MTELEEEAHAHTRAASVLETATAGATFAVFSISGAGAWEMQGGEEERVAQ